MKGFKQQPAYLIKLCVSSFLCGLRAIFGSVYMKRRDLCSNNLVSHCDGRFFPLENEFKAPRKVGLSGIRFLTLNKAGGSNHLLVQQFIELQFFFTGMIRLACK